MLHAPHPSTGVTGWVAFVLLWLGVALLAWQVSRPVRRRLFPPKRGEYVRVHHEFPTGFNAMPRVLTQTEVESLRARWDAAHERLDPSPQPRRRTEVAR